MSSRHLVDNYFFYFSQFSSLISQIYYLCLSLNIDKNTSVNIQNKIEQLITDFYPEIVGYYRYLHQNPELSYKEENTAQYIAEFLDKEGIAYRANIGGYGILAWVKGEKSDNGKTVAFVADMDALPVHEKNDIPYKSKFEGVMHACGHDSHTASLMGAAKIVNLLCNEFGGTALFLFQPGEEQSPGGADLMLKDRFYRKATCLR